MPVYTVHVFPVVHVRIPKVEASSPEEAIDKAESMMDLNRELQLVNTEYAEEISHYLVDEDGDPDYSKSVWFGPGKEKGWPSLFGLVQTIMNADPKELPSFMGINSTTDGIIELRLRKG
jgi:hypothetical protein